MFAIVVGGTNVSKTFTQNPENTKRRPGTAECTFASSLPTALHLDLGSQLGALGVAWQLYLQLLLKLEQQSQHAAATYLRFVVAAVAVAAGAARLFLRSFAIAAIRLFRRQIVVCAPGRMYLEFMLATHMTNPWLLYGSQHMLPFKIFNRSRALHAARGDNLVINGSIQCKCIKSFSIVVAACIHQIRSLSTTLSSDIIIN